MATVNDNRANDSKNTDISTINNVKNTNNFEDFIIKLKEPICKIKVNEGITCSTLLKDGRFAIGSNLHSIIIFNKKTFKPDLIIKEHKRSVYCLTQLSSGILASCSFDQTIKLFDITENKYNRNEITRFSTCKPLGTIHHFRIAKTQKARKPYKY